MKSLNNDWYKYINSLTEKYLPNDEIQKYAYSYKTQDPTVLRIINLHSTA